MILISKEAFLLEHNRLSPVNLQATFALLTQFQEEKKPLLKDTDWCMERLRMPLISWILALPLMEKKATRKKEKQVFKNYPETK